MGDSTYEPGRRVLIVQHSSSRDGSTFSGLLLADGLRRAGWETHVVFGHDGPMKAVYAERGHIVYTIEHKNWLRRRQPLRFLKDVYTEFRRAHTCSRLIQEATPSVVYINTAVSLCAAIAARRENVPVVWHLRELFSDVAGEMEAPGFAVPLVRQFFVRLSDRRVSPSRAVALNLLGPHASSVDVVPNAVNESFFSPDISSQQARERFELPPDGPIIGVPGMLRPMKGHVFFLDAIAPLARERRNLRILISGSGDPHFEDELKRRVSSQDLDRNVVFTGAIEDMVSFYMSCDLICIPSEAEPFGRTVIEAMACQRPVVATAVGGIPEIMEDGESGLLVDYGDQQSLRHALAELLDDEERRARLVSKAVRVARERYHIDAYQSSLNAIVKSLVSPEGEGGASR